MRCELSLHLTELVTITCLLQSAHIFPEQIQQCSPHSAIPPTLFLVFLGAVVVVDVVEGVVILALNCSATTTADWLFSMRSAE